MAGVKGVVGVGIAALAFGLAPAFGHTVGGTCIPGVDRCERWSGEVTGPPVREGERPDEFPSAVAVSGSTVYAGVTAVAFPVDDPYGSTASWTIAARDVVTGEERWRVFRRSRVYDSLHDLAVSPDGRTVVATGGAYDAFPVAATDSRIVTVAFDAATGAELWVATWDRRADGTDNGKVVAFAPDGRSVFVGGISRGAGGDLDYVTLSYDVRKGRQQWAEVYSGLDAGGTDALFDLAVAPDGDHVYVTGESAGARQYDVDYATVAYGTRSGRQAWVSRIDGGGLADRARAIAVDGERVFVTGDSFPGSGSDADTLTVALAAGDGTLAWKAELGGPGYDGGRAIAAADGRVIVTTQTRGATSDEGLDALTAAYEAAGGRELWQARLAEPRRSELANDLALQRGADVVYLVASSRPAIQYTALDEQRVLALRLADGSTAWRADLDAGAGNALKGDAIAVAPTGGVVTFGLRTRSADPLGPRDQDVHDSLLVALDG